MWQVDAKQQTAARADSSTPGTSKRAKRATVPVARVHEFFWTPVASSSSSATNQSFSLLIPHGNKGLYVAGELAHPRQPSKGFRVDWAGGEQPVAFGSVDGDGNYLVFEGGRLLRPPPRKRARPVEEGWVHWDPVHKSWVRIRQDARGRFVDAHGRRMAWDTRRGAWTPLTRLTPPSELAGQWASTTTDGRLMPLYERGPSWFVPLEKRRGGEWSWFDTERRQWRVLEKLSSRVKPAELFEYEEDDDVGARPRPQTHKRRRLGQVSTPVRKK